MQVLSNEITSGSGHMIVLFAKYHDQLALDLARPFKAVVTAGTKGMRMDVRCKITHRPTHPFVQRAAVRQVSPETHTSRTDASRACWKIEHVVNGEGGIFIVGGHFL